MTTKHTSRPVYAPEDVFPERPPRNNMQNFIYLSLPGHATSLIRHFGAPETTLVIGEIAVRHTFQRGLNPQSLRYPDLLIAFNVDPVEATARQGFAIDAQGKPPDFALEVASSSTARNDYIAKRTAYAQFGIPEYWRFDPTGGGRYGRYPVALAGDRLAGGKYQPIPIVQTDESRYWGHSEVLNLDLCWERGQLRWWDPASQSYLLTHDDEADARLAAESQRDAAESRADAERQARLAAQTQRDAAQAESAQAQARIRQLEEELRRRSQ